MVSFLLNKGAEINRTDDQGETALHLAAKISDEASLLELLNYKPNLHQLNDFFYTPLEYAAKYCDPTSFELFLEKVETDEISIKRLKYFTSDLEKITIIEKVANKFKRREERLSPPFDCSDLVSNCRNS